MQTEIHNERVLRSLCPGDRVQFSRGLYSHWAVYVGNGEVIHYSKTYMLIKKENFFSVARNHKALKNNSRKWRYRIPLPVNEILQRADSHLGRPYYNLLLDNCEHFVNLCCYGRRESDQVKRAVIGVGIAGFGLGVYAGVNELRKIQKRKRERDAALRQMNE
ncbi:unnamed protein product [Candidula unifasciata]|uniref:LRAT domain-containing protein n=1 Tax=Candidula unifasciata TaxID=100452 RepID=A0A8S3ZKJ7_9EUPU|nr:unnamed protein product [Candidula unifasciata]